MAAYPDSSLYFTQSVIAGGMLSGDYDRMYIVTPSQYGKSGLMGRLALLWGYSGLPVYIAGAAGVTSEIIMRQVDKGLQEIDAGIQEDITSLTKNQIEKLNRSLSKEVKRFKFKIEEN